MKKISKKIIAEIGSVHNGSVVKAKELVKLASKSGADIVKFQMHLADEETLKNAPSPKYFNKESRYDYFKRLEFNINQWESIKKFCEKNKVDFLCSPFSIKAVDILENLNVKFYKIASGELTNIPLLEKIKKTNKHIFVSTGMSNWKEISQAVKIFKKNFTLMQCSSIYPCSLKDVGINILDEMRKKFKKNTVQIGYSDHTLGYEASFLAASYGADIIEKHFTKSKKMYGSDAKHSMEPDEFKFFAKTIKNIWKLQSYKVDKDDLRKYKNMKKIFEKSIVAKEDLDKDTIIRYSHLDFKKPGDGIRADQYKKIIGKKVLKPIKKNKKINLSMFK